jgi:queuine tRNA-ribosyltransferase
MSDLMHRVRQAISDDTFDTLKKDFLAGYQPVDEGLRISQKKRWLERRNKTGD